MKNEISPVVILNSTAMKSPLPGTTKVKGSVSQEKNQVKFLLSSWRSFLPKMEGEKEVVWKFQVHLLPVMGKSKQFIEKLCWSDKKVKDHLEEIFDLLVFSAPRWESLFISTINRKKIYTLILLRCCQCLKVRILIDGWQAPLLSFLFCCCWWWLVGFHFFSQWCIVPRCDGLAPAGGQVPTKAILSLPPPQRDRGQKTERKVCGQR